MTMTLEQLRDDILKLHAERPELELDVWADAIDAHLSAQAKVQVTDEENREAFEAWMLETGEAYFGKSDFRIGEAGEYEEMETYAAWIAWKGATESFAARLSQDAHGKAVGFVSALGLVALRRGKEARAYPRKPDDGRDYAAIYTQPAQSSVNSGEVAQGEAFQLSQGFVDRVTNDDAKEPPVMGAGSHDSIKRIAEEMVHACKVVRQGDGEFTHDAVDDWAHRIMCFANYTHPAERAAVPEGSFDFCTDRFTATLCADNRYEITKDGVVQWGRVLAEDMRLKIETGEWTVLSAATTLAVNDCTHEWVDATNSHVSNTALCVKCGKLSPLGSVTLAPTLAGKENGNV